MPRHVTTTKDPKDGPVPIGLVIAGLAIFAFLGFKAAGGKGAFRVITYVLIASAIGSTLMLVAAFVTAKVIGVSFGEVGPASLKLSAIYIFPAALAALIPMGWIIGIVITLGLLMWLFELEVPHALVFMVIWFLVNLLTGYLLRQIL